MPLDQAAEAFIETATSKPSKPLSATSVVEMRESVEVWIPLGFDREDVHFVEDGAVEGVTVRSYMPSAQPPATVIYLHGGSFTRCGLRTHDTLLRRFANRSGCTVVAVDYSLAPEAIYPRQLDEIDAIVGSVLGPGGKLFLAGDSSGGCLAAATALRLRDRGEIDLSGVVLMLPVLDRDSGTESRHTLDKGYLLSGEQLDWMFDQYAPNAAVDDPLVFPFRATDLRGFPPTIVVTAEFDPLRDEGHAFAERIRAAGGHAEDVCVPGIIHHAPLVPKQIPAGARVIDDAADLLRKLAA
jgi:acetyl esterase